MHDWLSVNAYYARWAFWLTAMRAELITRPWLRFLRTPCAHWLSNDASFSFFFFCLWTGSQNRHCTFFWLPDSEYHKMDTTWIVVVSWWQTEQLWNKDGQTKQTNKQNKQKSKHRLRKTQRQQQVRTEQTVTWLLKVPLFLFWKVDEWKVDKRWMKNLKDLWRENNKVFRIFT